MLEFTLIGWIVVLLCAALIGFSKTGMPGAGILVVPLLATAMDSKESVGFLLPILCMADIMAVIYWRRHADWPKLLKLLPWALAGLVIGYFCHKQVFVEGRQGVLSLVIGLVVLGLIGLTTWRNSRRGQEVKIPTNWYFAALMGLLAGTTTMLANAAGPVMVIYFLAMKLDKEHFLGTGAWYFWMLNLIKIPFMVDLGMINSTSVTTNLVTLPFIAAGGVLGILLVHRLNDKIFTRVVTVLAVAAAVALVVKGLL
ncbi:MAG: sulfite exporter TauE/SafE family protein [Sedimentisphaerales bacterium]|nr:sulfite exporter TauE/SafE family protein [Sedimentisphaerales bacterium]